MVRVISQHFQPGLVRSRNNSGESAIDQRSTANAVQALINFENENRKRHSSSESNITSSSYDSIWDSDAESLQDHINNNVISDNFSENSNEEIGRNELIRKRKERRRERNKLSAQAYRMRKRQHLNNQDKILAEEEKRKKQLLETLKELEEEKSIVDSRLRKIGYLPWPSNFSFYNSDVNGNGNVTYPVDTEEQPLDMRMAACTTNDTPITGPTAATTGPTTTPACTAAMANSGTTVTS